MRTLAPLLALAISLPACDGDGGAEERARLRQDLAALRAEVSSLKQAVEAREAEAGLQVVLPPATTAPAGEALELAIDATAISIAGAAVDDAALDARLEAHVAAHGPQAAVELQVPAELSHQRVTQVLDRVRAAGITRVSIRAG